MAPRIQYATSADGVQIAFTSLGEGPPVVVAANAWGDINMYSTGASWPMFDRLVRGGRRVILYDGRGSGSSEREVTDMSPAARLADMESVVDKVGLDQFQVIAMIHGTPTAVAYAVEYPDRVTRLALYSAYADGEAYYASTPMLRAMRTLSEMAEDHWEFYILTLANWAVRFDRELSTRIAGGYRSGMNPKQYLAFIHGGEQTNVTRLLPNVSCPTLVIRDATSPFSTEPEFTQRVAAAIPNAQLVTVKNLPAAGDAILDFLGVDSGKTSATADSAFRTILFTDLVGHTEMMRRLGDESGRAVLREHEEITRDVLKRHGGSEVKTMGDGFMASFTSVTSAVQCALALQARFAERNAGAAEPLNVRVGLNAGEPIAEDGDLFGETVILASRMAGMAKGGEILASLGVRELCAGKGFLFADVGEHAMRGFEDPVRVFEVKRG